MEHEQIAHDMMRALLYIVLGILLALGIERFARSQTYGENAPPPMQGFDTGISANGGPVNTQDTTHGFQINGQTVLNSAGLAYPAASTTGGATQTFTNSPCTGNTTAQWVPITITGQSGTFYVPACQ